MWNAILYPIKNPNIYTGSNRNILYWPENNCNCLNTCSGYKSDGLSYIQPQYGTATGGIWYPNNKMRCKDRSGGHTRWWCSGTLQNSLLLLDDFSILFTGVVEVDLTTTVLTGLPTTTLGWTEVTTTLPVSAVTSWAVTREREYLNVITEIKINWDYVSCCWHNCLVQWEMWLSTISVPK